MFLQEQQDNLSETVDKYLKVVQGVQALRKGNYGDSSIGYG